MGFGWARPPVKNLRKMNPITICHQPLPLSDRAHMFEEMYANQELFDLNIFCNDSAVEKISDSRSLGAHRIILAAVSPVLRRMFTGEFIESGQSSINLDIDLWAMKKTLQFVYCGTTQVETVEQLVKIGQVADKLDIEKLRECAITLASELLSIESCATILQAASVSGLNTLEEKSREFLCRQFCEVANTEGFLKLDEASGIIHLL
jgi:hypothetical protein